MKLDDIAQTIFRYHTTVAKQMIHSRLRNKCLTMGLCLYKKPSGIRDYLSRRTTVKRRGKSKFDKKPQKPNTALVAAAKFSGGRFMFSAPKYSGNIFGVIHRAISQAPSPALTLVRPLAPPSQLLLSVFHLTPDFRSRGRFPDNALLSAPLDTSVNSRDKRNHPPKSVLPNGRILQRI